MPLKEAVRRAFFAIVEKHSGSPRECKPFDEWANAKKDLKGQQIYRSFVAGQRLSYVRPCCQTGYRWMFAEKSCRSWHRFWVDLPSDEEGAFCWPHPLTTWPKLPTQKPCHTVVARDTFALFFPGQASSLRCVYHQFYQTILIWR